MSAWAAEWMPVLGLVRDRLRDEGAVAGRRIAVNLPLEPKAEYLAAVLTEVGAEVSVGAAGELLERKPEVVIDDRAEVARLAHTTHPEALADLVGVSEQSASGVRYLRTLDALQVPCIAADDARCLFDTGQSVVNAILDRTNLLAADKDVVVVGYGAAGKGIAARWRGLGARVTVCEADPLAALAAHHDGFDVAPLLDACRSANVVIGLRHAIGPQALAVLPDGAILARSGGGEIDVAHLPTREARDRVDELTLPDGRTLFLVGGDAVLSAAEGQPAEIADLALAVHALSAAYLLRHGGELEPGVHRLPAEIDDEIARMKLQALGIEIDGDAV